MESNSLELVEWVSLSHYHLQNFGQMNLRINLFAGGTQIVIPDTGQLYYIK